MLETHARAAVENGTRTAASDRLAALHAADLPQKDSLCGCFWGALVLRAAGVEQAGGAPVTQDLVAVAAGTTLPTGDPADAVPPGETPRRDYAAALPLAAPAAAGTSPAALARAVARLAEGRLAVVPVAGPWTGERVARLVGLAGRVSTETALVANVRTGRLWGARADPSLLLAHLAGRPVSPPATDWDVGHFVNLVTLVRGAVGALVVVRDSYRTLGWEAHHLQPPGALAAALDRGDGLEGGVLCIGPVERERKLRAALERAGWELRFWDNGTPDPGEARFAPR